MTRAPSRTGRGLTLVELVIALAIGLMVVISAATLHLVVQRSFTWGARKLAVQQEASRLASAISRRVRVASRSKIYRLPDRETPVYSGNGVALWDADGQLLGRIEWSDSLHTVVDAAGKPITSEKVQNLEFRRLIALPPIVLYYLKVDDGKGSLVDIESAAFMRN
jgi:hypothetical protein